MTAQYQKYAGNALGELGLPKEAIEAYDQAIKFKPDDHRAWNNKGNTLGEGRSEEAAKAFEQADKLKPK